jgi:hypothetical protein
MKFYLYFDYIILNLTFYCNKPDPVRWINLSKV